MFLIWIYKTKKKIVELGMTEAQYSPGFSVGCFFIPLGNLVLPFQATRELWRASINPPLWRDQKSSPLVGVWWTSWLITALLPLAFFAASKFMVGMAALRFTTVGLMVCAAISAVSCILTIRLAHTVSAQLNTYGLAQGKTPESNSPFALWDPNAAACWSVVFTPAFSAYIHGRNAEALGNVEEARMNRVWFYASKNPVSHQQLAEKELPGRVPSRESGFATMSFAPPSHRAEAAFPPSNPEPTRGCRGLRAGTRNKAVAHPPAWLPPRAAGGSTRRRLHRAALALLGCALVVPLVAQKSLQPEIAAPLPPAEAAATMVVPPGFKVTLFAGEPDVRQPISFCLDDRGRLWVAEALNYPKHGLTPGDRIVIFEDTDGDGRFDRRKVFGEFFNYISGIEVGFGGVWVMSPPHFYFIPDRDGDDRPDGEPEVRLDGFGTHANSHNIANGFSWGPDGWLYNTHGRTNWSLIGRPGTPKEQRTRFDGGIWRYHPVHRTWEPFIDGTTNPWAIDWDDHGQAFTTTSVDPHLYHVIQGAHYEPWRNRESSQYAYERIATIADHLHFIGQGRVQDGLGTREEDAAGGGHSHCGAMVYLGDNWPDHYRNSIFMHNIHGRRINQDVLRRSGSGFVATHAPDFMRSRDPWFMGVILRYGPDGAVYSIDWSDTGECHSVRNTRKETGRIYKIAYGTPRPPEGRIDELDDLGLVARQLHRNDWHVRHARRLLQERAAAGRDLTAARRELRRLFAAHPEVSRKLRALWALHVTGGAGADFLTAQLDHENEYVRGWAIQLLCEDRNPPPAALAGFERLAVHDPSPLVRLNLASALQRVDRGSRRSIGAALAAHGEDSGDQNLPLMVWYGIEPLVHENRAEFMALAATARIPLLRRHVARRVTEEARDAGALEPLVRLLAAGNDLAVQSDILDGLLTGIASQGLRNPGLPPSWPAAYAALMKSPDTIARGRARRLALVFDDPRALAELRQQAADPSADAEERRQAIEALVAKKPPGFAPFLIAQLADPVTAGPAARGLAAFDVPETAASLLRHFSRLDAPARRDAIQTLASRPAWAARLLDAVEANTISRAELTAYTARQLANLGDPTIAQRTTALWGEMRPAPAEQKRLITNYRGSLTPGAIKAADRPAGRTTYQKLCASCHRLFGEGGDIGPDLTGSQRTNLDYLLENIIYPNAAVSRDYQLQMIETNDGRVVSGFVITESPGAVTVRAINEKIVIPANEIRKRTVSPVSMMPEGLLQGLTPRETQELFSYLSGPGQVPLATGTSPP